jgi:hypothetical protein
MNPNLYPFFQAVNAKKQSSAILPLMPKSKETARSTAALTTTHHGIGLVINAVYRSKHCTCAAVSTTHATIN